MLKKIIALGEVLGMMVSVVNASENDLLMSYDDFVSSDLGKIISDAVYNKIDPNTVISSDDHGISAENLLKLKPAAKILGPTVIQGFYISQFPEYYDTGLTSGQEKAAVKLLFDLVAISKK